METAVDDYPEYIALGGACPRCEREGWIDRFEVRRKWGNAILGSLQPRLRCLGCGNKESNLRIPMKPATDSDLKPASHSDFIPASVPI
ncbi:hypothetical protein ELI02_02180 [Rhizobium leguminosarum]|uniref:hypothetical protein n=1 Tax=Rhizobium leguminosarum TaxID=384 RepID=UPI0010318ED0|nr:hypothetical protein [Rhizobium leguminosarum]TAX58926.1 hypothetical protein ELI02_02180 [Rhizobium leguminosarum]